MLRILVFVAKQTETASFYYGGLLFFKLYLLKYIVNNASTGLYMVLFAEGTFSCPFTYGLKK